jgi:hypothetical protein
MRPFCSNLCLKTGQERYRVLERQDRAGETHRSEHLGLASRGPLLALYRLPSHLSTTLQYPSDIESERRNRLRARLEPGRGHDMMSFHPLPLEDGFQ